MRRRRFHAAPILILVSGAGVVIANGCSATADTHTFKDGGNAGGGGGAGSSHSASSGGDGGRGGDVIIVTDSGPPDSPVEDVFQDPCESKCGPIELCDPEHLGLDDNCDGNVDEGCGCSAGQAHACFKGDPHFHGTAGCFDGTEVCNEQGHWGPCIGGFHAAPPDNCYMADVSACHAISAPPFADVQLHTGTGSFKLSGAGTEAYTVSCPAGVSPCPGVMAPDLFKPLQSGQYDITYTKTPQGQPAQMCTFPLFIGAPGLRVELSWDHSVADDGVDLDLHVHQPNNTQPWGISPGKSQDCTWSNCVFTDFKPPQGGGAPKWFADLPVMPPIPVNWYLDPVLQNNTCYFAPRGVGLEWQSLGMGCHNPRLDLDNINCDFAVQDPNQSNFCAPENVNIDYPPSDQWMRVAVHYYSSHGLTYDVHPEIKIFCNGALAADLGPAGYYSPESPVTFTPSDGAGVGGNRFWMVADVAFKNDMCGKSDCTVRPIYSDAVGKTPFYTIDSAATSVFAPNYPPLP